LKLQAIPLNLLLVLRSGLHNHGICLDLRFLEDRIARPIRVFQDSVRSLLCIRDFSS
jgi:hypothetical protein